MSKVFIYCGIPGAGKSTIVANRHGAMANVCSSDLYFMEFDRATDALVYKFDASKLGEAHGQCLRFFITEVHNGEAEIIVDNTNTTIAEIAPYVAIAQAYSYDVEVITVLCEPEKAHARNVHGVPLEAIKAMAERLERRDMPPWWKHSVIDQCESVPSDTGRAA